MTPTLALWFVASIACDVAGQLCFKLGADSIEAEGWRATMVATLRQPWILAGIAIYIVEIFVWLRILALVPLSIAFPIASLNFIGVTLASQLILNERIGRRGWAGVLFITIGAAIVARSA